MEKMGKFVRGAIAERAMISRGLLRGAYHGGKFCKKQEKIHVAVQDDFHAKSIRMEEKRCTCGGYTFSTIWDGRKVVCRHCGKQYFIGEYNTLPDVPLEDYERDFRYVYMVMLSGGDLREHREENYLVFKDSNGLDQGTFPIPFADVFADAFPATARICYTVLEAKQKNHIAMPAPEAMAAM